MSHTLAPALVRTWEGVDWISRARVPCTAKSQMMMPLRGSSHQASNSSPRQPALQHGGRGQHDAGPAVVQAPRRPHLRHIAQLERVVRRLHSKAHANVRNQCSRYGGA